MDDNFYQLLGVSPTASLKEIHKAYLALAKQLHPDKNKDNPTATADFQKLNEAYHTLKEPESRREYDRKNMKYSEQSYHYAEVIEEDHSVYEGIVTKVNTMSLTIHIPPDFLDIWISVIQDRYNSTFMEAKKGQPSNGQMLKVVYESEGGPLGTVSITVYKSTSNLHVQGTPFFLWLQEHLPGIKKLVCEAIPKNGLSLGPNKRRSRRQMSMITANLDTQPTSKTCKICTSDITKDTATSQCVNCNALWHDNCAIGLLENSDGGLCIDCVPTSGSSSGKQEGLELSLPTISESGSESGEPSQGGASPNLLSQPVNTPDPVSPKDNKLEPPVDNVTSLDNKSQSSITNDNNEDKDKQAPGCSHTTTDSQPIQGQSTGEGASKEVTQSTSQTSGSESVEGINSSNSVQNNVSKATTSSPKVPSKSTAKTAKVKGKGKGKMSQHKQGAKSKIKALEGKIVGLQRSLHSVASSITDNKPVENCRCTILESTIKSMAENCRCIKLESTIKSMAGNITKIERNLNTPNPASKELEAKLLEHGYNFKCLELKYKEAESQNLQLRLLADDLQSQVNNLKAGKQNHEVTETGTQCLPENQSQPELQNGGGLQQVPNVATSNRFLPLNQLNHQQEENVTSQNKNGDSAGAAASQVTDENSSPQSKDSSSEHAKSDSHASKVNKSSKVNPSPTTTPIFEGNEHGMDPKVEWFSGENHVLSNLYQPGKDLICFHNKYHSVEQGFKHAECLYHNWDKLAEQVMSTDKARDCMNLVKDFLIKNDLSTSPEWQIDQYLYMEQLLISKHRDWPEYKLTLSQLEGYIIKEKTFNRYWGACHAEGQNKLGQLHMKLRDNPPEHVIKPIFNPTASSKPTLNESKPKHTATPKSRTVSGDGVIITDSLASRVDGKYMYKQKKAIRVYGLPEGEKTLGGATAFIKDTKINAKSVTLVAGSNDLSKDSTEGTIYKAKHMISTAKAETGPNTQISLYAIPPRKQDTRWKNFEQKRIEYNNAMRKFCREQNVKFIETSIQIENICNDRVHLYYGEERLIVRDIKKVINPIFGLSPPQYSDEYGNLYGQEGGMHQSKSAFGSSQGAWGHSSHSQNFNYGQFPSDSFHPSDFSTPPPFTSADFPPLNTNGQQQQDQVLKLAQELARLFQQASL